MVSGQWSPAKKEGSCMVASYSGIHHSILWTVDQCWNILHPTYAGWAIQGILDAANNKNITTPAGTAYTWNNQAGGTSNTGPSTNVTDVQDAGNRKFAKYIKIADELNNGDESVKTKLQTYWTVTLRSEPKKLWKDPPFQVPVIILSVVGGVLGLLLIMGIIVVFKIDEVTPFIITGISFSVLTSTSTFSSLIPANGQDKVKLNEIRITGEQYEYYNFAALYTGTGSTATTVASQDNNNDTETNPGGDQKIAASSVQNNYHFKTNGNEPKHAPKIRVTTGNTTTKAEGIAKANIIDV